MLTFATLGPEEGKHHFVLHQYLEAHCLHDAARVFTVLDLVEGGRAVLDGKADYFLEVAQDVTEREIGGSWRERLALVDAFTSPGPQMVLIQARCEGGLNGKLGIQKDMVGGGDLSNWPEFVRESTVHAVQEGLRTRRYEAGVVSMAFAVAHSSQFQVVALIDNPRQGWLVYGRESVGDGSAAVWRDSPVARRYWLGVLRTSAESSGREGV